MKGAINDTMKDPMKDTDKINAFLGRHIPVLLKRLNNIPKSLSGKNIKKGKRSIEYVDSVLDEWRENFIGRRLPTPSEKERTFWFTLYQYESLEEFPFPMGKVMLTYEGMMLKNLKTARDRLRLGAGLPDDLFATRPGEDPCADELTEDDFGEGGPFDYFGPYETEKLH